MNFFLEPSNLILEGVIVVSALSLAMPYITRRQYGMAIDSKTLTMMVNQQKAQVIELRDAADYKKGHIPKSTQMSSEEANEILTKYSKERAYILVDNSGELARMVSRMMKQMGFQNVSYLDGGINAWVKQGLPLVK